MAKPRRRRAGRKRKVDLIREPGGRISRAAYREPIIPEAVLEQRKRMAPRADKDALRTEGTPLALLRANGDITTMQFDAGEKLGSLWRAWASAASIPPRWPVTSDGGSGHEVSAERWQRLKRDMDDALEVIEQCEQSRFTYAVLESVCVDEVMPPHLRPNHGMRPAILNVLTGGLDALAMHFRIAPREQGKDAA